MKDGHGHYNITMKIDRHGIGINKFTEKFLAGILCEPPSDALGRRLQVLNYCIGGHWDT